MTLNVAKYALKACLKKRNLTVEIDKKVLTK